MGRTGMAFSEFPFAKKFTESPSPNAWPPPDLDTRRVEPGSGAPGKEVRTDLPRSHQPGPDESQRHHGRIGLESERTPLVVVGRGHQRHDGLRHPARPRL